MRNYTPNEMKILDAIMDKMDRQVPNFSTVKVISSSKASKWLGVYGKVDGMETEGGFMINISFTDGN